MTAASSDPIAKTLPSAPNAPALLWKTLVERSALNIWKLSPKVEAKKTVVITAIRSGLLLI